MTQQLTTIFEKIIAGELPCTKVYEDGDLFAFLDIHPVAKGHTLLITKQPIPWIQDVPDDLISKAFIKSKDLIKAMKTDLKNWKFTDVLRDVGLNGSEAKIYEYLLNNGAKRASVIAKQLELSRVITYRFLDNLVRLAVVEKIEREGSVAMFMAQHPGQLSTLLERKKQQLTKAELELQHTLGAMASAYNLAGGKPNVQFFEGVKGIKKVAFDSLTAEEVVTIVDAERFRTKYPTLNVEFTKQRQLTKQKKRVLFNKGTPVITKNDPWVEHRAAHLRIDAASLVNIYDDSVSFITLDDDRDIGIIIQDQGIATFMKSVFENLWQGADQPPKSGDHA